MATSLSHMDRRDIGSMYSRCQCVWRAAQAEVPSWLERIMSLKAKS